MRKIYYLLFIGLISCGEPTDTKQDKPETQATTTQQQSIDGTYEHIYPHNTDNHTENQYIIIQNNTGLFYGTSDEFDEAREGYLPGFFVSDLKDLQILKDKLTFKLKITETDLYDKPIRLDLKSSAEVQKAGYTLWDTKIPLEEKQYEGLIHGDTIVLKSQIAGYDKQFVKKK